MTYFNLGAFQRAVVTATPEARVWFDRGLTWLYGFNHEEAIVCFEKAVAADPGCVLAHWGIAHAIGPNYNKMWEVFTPEEKVAALARAHRALAEAKAALAGATPAERALVEALAHRFPDDPTVEDYGPWNDAFSASMRKVHEAFPDDLDVAAIFAEALMNRTPWKLWDLPGRKPAEGASTAEAQRVLERGLLRASPQPGTIRACCTCTST